jgi:hypothetical protein
MVGASYSHWNVRARPREPGRVGAICLRVVALPGRERMRMPRSAVNKLAKRRAEMWAKDPRCEVCAVETFLPEDGHDQLSRIIPGYSMPTKRFHRTPTGALRRHRLLPRMATIDHFYPKRHALRCVPTPETRRYRLLCWACNNKRGSKDFDEFKSAGGAVW